MVDTRGVEGVVILEDGKAWPLDFDPFLFTTHLQLAKHTPFSSRFSAQFFLNHLEFTTTVTDTNNSCCRMGPDKMVRTFVSEVPSALRTHCIQYSVPLG